MPHEIYVAASSGAPKKIDPRISAIFFQTADVECGFSDQNLIKTILRNRLGEEFLDNLKGLPLSKFDFHEACLVCVRKRTGKVEKSRSESRVTEAFFLKTCGLKERKLFILMLDESTEYM